LVVNVHTDDRYDDAHEMLWCGAKLHSGEPLI
jgi:hypothetical protein